jgi:hypothetical protein
MGQTRCNGICVSTSLSNLNCGMCGRMCASNQVCAFGNCITVQGCPVGQVRCQSGGGGGGGGLTTCVNTQTSNTNCGQCGVSCPTGTTCMSGVCR